MPSGRSSCGVRGELARSPRASVSSLDVRRPASAAPATRAVMTLTRSDAPRRAAAAATTSPRCAGGLAVGELLADERQDVAAVVDGVVEVVVAADRDQVGAEVDVVEDRGGDGLVLPTSAVEAPCAPVAVGGRRPQGPVVQRPARAAISSSRCEPTFCRARRAALTEVATRARRLRVVSAGPRACGAPSPRRAPRSRRRSGGTSPRSAGVSVRPARAGALADAVDLLARCRRAARPRGRRCRRARRRRGRRRRTIRRPRSGSVP